MILLYDLLPPFGEYKNSAFEEALVSGGEELVQLIFKNLIGFRFHHSNEYRLFSRS